MLNSAPDLVRAALAQGQQAGAMVDLAVQQDDSADGRVAQCAGRLQGGKGFELGTDIRGGVAQYPVLAVVAQGNRGLAARLRAQAAGAYAAAVAAVAIPLGKTAACGGTENLDMHGGYRWEIPG
jgi:hypothetical protein